MNRRRLLLCAGALSIAGCASGAGSPRMSEAAGLEPLYAVAAGRAGLTVIAASNGCTRREDFVFYLERRGETPALAFARRRLDTCRQAAAAPAELVFRWEELGLAPGAEFMLLNPLMARSAP